MSKYEKQLSDYQKHSKNMFLTLTTLTAVIVLNAIIVTTGVADSYYSEVYNWLTISL